MEALALLAILWVIVPYLPTIYYSALFIIDRIKNEHYDTDIPMSNN